MKNFYYILLLISLIMYAQDSESFSWKEARLNDKFELTLSKAEFDKRCKKADSITVADIGETCRFDDGDNVQTLHYKGAKYELYNDTLNFRSIDFTKRKGMYFSIENDWFDHTTTLKSFMKTYPVAAEYITDEITPEGDVHDLITLYPEGEDSYEWRFYFNEGKLHSIECWLYCD